MAPYLWEKLRTIPRSAINLFGCAWEVAILCQAQRSFVVKVLGMVRDSIAPGDSPTDENATSWGAWSRPDFGRFKNGASTGLQERVVRFLWSTDGLDSCLPNLILPLKLDGKRLSG